MAEPARTLTLQNDSVEIFGPFNDSSSAYTHFYRNKDTRALDERFGLDGKWVSDDDPRTHFLDKAAGPCSLGKSEVEATLRYFVRIAKNITGHFVGFREEEIKAQIERSPILRGNLDLETSLRYQDGTRGSYLVRQEVDGHQVIFPRNLPKLWL